MSLNNNERRLLELAREKIANGNSKFVCNSIEEVVANNAELKSAAERLLAYIKKALDGHFTLLIWQDEKGVRKGLNDEQLRCDRLAWIDWMLDQPEAE